MRDQRTPPGLLAPMAFLRCITPENLSVVCSAARFVEQDTITEDSAKLQTVVTLRVVGSWVVLRR